MYRLTESEKKKSIAQTVFNNTNRTGKIKT